MLSHGETSGHTYIVIVVWMSSLYLLLVILSVIYAECITSAWFWVYVGGLSTSLETWIFFSYCNCDYEFYLISNYNIGPREIVIVTVLASSRLRSSKLNGETSDHLYKTNMVWMSSNYLLKVILSINYAKCMTSAWFWLSPGGFSALLCLCISSSIRFFSETGIGLQRRGFFSYLYP